jgi:hypothetical protein
MSISRKPLRKMPFSRIPFSIRPLGTTLDRMMFVKMPFKGRTGPECPLENEARQNAIQKNTIRISLIW